MTVLLVKIEEKNVFCTSAFSLSCVTRSPISFSTGLLFFLVFLLFSCVLVFETPTQIPFHLDLAFLNPLLDVQTESLYSSQATICGFTLFIIAFLCLILARSYLFSHADVLAINFIFFYSLKFLIWHSAGIKKDMFHNSVAIGDHPSINHQCSPSFLTLSNT